jgi:hypothetical protein
MSGSRQTVVLSTRSCCLLRGIPKHSACRRRTRVASGLPERRHTARPLGACGRRRWGLRAGFASNGSICVCSWPAVGGSDLRNDVFERLFAQTLCLELRDISPNRVPRRTVWRRLLELGQQLPRTSLLGSKIVCKSRSGRSVIRVGVNDLTHGSPDTRLQAQELVPRNLEIVHTEPASTKEVRSRRGWPGIPYKTRSVYEFVRHFACMHVPPGGR